MSDLKALLKSSCVFRREPFTTKGGVTVYFREWSAADHEWWSEEMSRRFPKEGTAKYAGIRANLLIRTIVDADGKPVWKPEDSTALSGELTELLAEELYTAARKFNGLDKDDAEKKD